MIEWLVDWLFRGGLSDRLRKWHVFVSNWFLNDSMNGWWHGSMTLRLTACMTFWATSSLSSSSPRKVSFEPLSWNPLSLYLKLPLLWDTSLVSFVLPEPTPLSAPSSPKYLKLFLTPWLSISPTFLPTVLLWGGQTIGFCQQPPLEPNLPSSRNRSSFRHSRGMLTFLGLGDMGHHSYKQFFRNNCGIHSIATSHSLVRYSAQ